MRVNPFKPNAPIPPGMFAGRLREIERIDYALTQTRAGNASGFLITGERGIGKSSLLFYARAVAEGGMDLLGGDKLRFLVIYTDIEGTTSQMGLVKKIETGLRMALDSEEKPKAMLRSLWEFLQRIEVGGVSLRGDSTKPNSNETLTDETAYSLARTINTITTERTASDLGLSNVYDGVLLLIDEADSAAPDLNLGAFLKLLIERVQRERCNRLCVGLAGLPKVVDVLRRSHESSLRLFEQLPLGALSPHDIRKVIERGLAEANEQNTEQTTIDADAREMLAVMSEGLPHFIQQFASSAFGADSDGRITVDDVLDSSLGPGGAYELIGNRYYRDAFYSQIRQELYRKVLRIMADESGWVGKATIRAKLQGRGKDTTLTNAIHTLIEKGLIIREPGKVGSYKLVSRGLAVWIKGYTKDPQEAREALFREAAPGDDGSGTGS